MTYIPTRPAAVSLLIRVIDHRQTLDEALVQDEVYNLLDGPDRGMARAIASAALRHLGHLDIVLAQHVTGRAFADLDPDVRHLLRVGAAQICLLKTPSHAAVSETVQAAKGFERARLAGGLINAVLRKLQPDSLDELKLPASSTWPYWFEDLIKEALPERAEALAEAALGTPPLDLTVPHDRETWAETLGGSLIGQSSVRLTTGSVENLKGYVDGAWWVQDVAATLPVMLLAPKKDEQILDLCAAPGGKTLQIASSGAHVTALDRSAKRLRLVKQNLSRTGLKAECIAADATKWKTETVFDGVLVDAPCSALGTLRRHPEGPWIKHASDLERFPAIQARLLEVAAGFVRPGGRMVYCVCTPLNREGVDIVDAFLADNPEWSREPASSDELGSFAGALTQKGDVATMPPLLADVGGCDAFFMSRLVRAGG